jgi:selenocysteine lyase/cysteine desulfurase
MDYMEAVYDHHHGENLMADQKAKMVRNLFRNQETLLLQPLLDYLSDHPKVKLIGKQRAASRAPTVAFTVEDQPPTELAARLSEHKLGVGTGHFYAYRLIEALDIGTDDGVLRTSFVHYTHPDEIARLINALDELL